MMDTLSECTFFDAERMKINLFYESQLMDRLLVEPPLYDDVAPLGLCECVWLVWGCIDE